MSLIDELVAAARERARSLPADGPAPKRPEGPTLAEALRGKERLAVIAEFKLASPSEGAIAQKSVEEQVTAYERAGASALSVLTEPTRFRGSFDDLARAARAVSVPALMKDFVVSPAHVRQAAVLGARGVLLIVRCLSDSQLEELVGAVREYGLTALVECHTEEELDRALQIEPEEDDVLLGVNNRDLDTLAVDTSVAPRLLARVDPSRIVVAESGYASANDVREVRGLADAVLIGTALMRHSDPGALIEAIRG